MSLINDALKRAQQSQAATGDRSQKGPRMQPVASRPHSLAPLFILPLVLTAVLALAVFLVLKGWQAFRDDATPPASPAHSGAGAATAPTVSASELVVPPPPSAPQSQTAPPADLAATLPPPSPSPAAAHDADAAAGSSPAAETLPTPARATLRLQGISYRPGRSSAMLNGDTFFVGEFDGSLKVLDIQRTSVTVEWEGATQVLTLE